MFECEGAGRAGMRLTRMEDVSKTINFFPTLPSLNRLTIFIKFSRDHEISDTVYVPFSGAVYLSDFQPPKNFSIIHDIFYRFLHRIAQLYRSIV